MFYVMKRKFVATVLKSFYNNQNPIGLLQNSFFPTLAKLAI